MRFIKIMINYKIKAVLLIIGIGVCLGFGSFWGFGDEKNLNLQTTGIGAGIIKQGDVIGKVEKALESSDQQMGVYYPHSTRKLTIEVLDPNLALVDLPKTLAEAVAAAFMRNAASTSNYNAFSIGGGGFSNSNTASSSFSSPILSLSISNANSMAVGGNAASSAGAGAASGPGTAASQGNAAASALGLGIGGIPSASASFATAVTATIAGQSFSNSNSASFSQNFNQVPQHALNGKYQLSFPTVTMRVTRNDISLRGCDRYRIPYEWEGDNIRFGSVKLAQSNCRYDQALKILQRLPQVTKFRRSGKDLICLNDKKQQLFTVKQWQLSKRKKRADQDFYEYTTVLPSYNIEIDQNSLYFQGYRDHPVKFQYSNPNLISFRKSFVKKTDLGFYDDDNSIADFFLSCSRVNVREDRGFWFVDDSGKSLADCSRKAW